MILFCLSLALADIAPPPIGQAPPPPRGPTIDEASLEAAVNKNLPPGTDPDDPAWAAGLIPGLDPGPPPPSADVDRLAHEIGLTLRCPVCQGLSVADSTSVAAVQMQRRIRELVGLGYTRADIEDYFVSRYGEWILLSPTAGGLNLLVWLGPLLAAGLGLGLASTFLRAPAARPAPAAPTADDPYTRRLLAEVDDDQ